MSGEGILPNDPNPPVVGWDLGVDVTHRLRGPALDFVTGRLLEIPTAQDMREWLDEFNTREWRDEQPFNRRCPHGEFIEMTGCWLCIEESRS